MKTRAAVAFEAKKPLEIVELDLNDDELGALRAAAEGIRAKCADLATL